MNPFSTVRLIGSVVGLIAALTLAYLVKDRFHQKDLAEAAQHCDLAVLKGAMLDACLPNVKGKVEVARKAEACDEALLPSLRPETRFAMGNACPAGVKRLVADFDARAADVADRERMIATLQATRSAEVARAETRASRQQERDDHARHALDAAPRDAGGSIHCDAVCLRQLGQ